MILLLLFWEGTKQRLNFVGFHAYYSHQKFLVYCVFFLSYLFVWLMEK